MYWVKWKINFTFIVFKMWLLENLKLYLVYIFIWQLYIESNFFFTFIPHNTTILIRRSLRKRWRWRVPDFYLSSFSLHLSYSSLTYFYSLRALEDSCGKSAAAIECNFVILFNPVPGRRIPLSSNEMSFSFFPLLSN